MKHHDLELNTRSKLLTAAVEVFGKHGFDAASVRQIAEIAEVNHGAVKYHYSSKGDLWRAAVAYLFDKMNAAVHANEDQWSEMTPRQRIIDNIGTYVRFNAKHPELHRMIVFETMRGGERLEWLMESYMRPFADRAINAVALAQEEGVYPRDIPPMNLHYINVAAGRTLFLMAPEVERNFGVDVFSDAEVERHIDAIIKLFLPAQDADEEAPADRSTSSSEAPKADSLGDRHKG